MVNQCLLSRELDCVDCEIGITKSPNSTGLIYNLYESWYFCFFSI